MRPVAQPQMPAPVQVDPVPPHDVGVAGMQSPVLHVPGPTLLVPEHVAVPHDPVGYVQAPFEPQVPPHMVPAPMQSAFVQQPLMHGPPGVQALAGLVQT